MNNVKTFKYSIEEATMRAASVMESFGYEVNWSCSSRPGTVVDISIIGTVNPPPCDIADYGEGPELFSPLSVATEPLFGFLRAPVAFSPDWVAPEDEVPGLQRGS